MNDCTRLCVWSASVFDADRPTRAIAVGDRTTLGVMLAQPLVITALVCAVCRKMPTIDFLLVVSALWFGCSGAAQQIVKERAIYRRERLVNLRLDALNKSAWFFRSARHPGKVHRHPLP